MAAKRHTFMNDWPNPTVPYPLPTQSNVVPREIKLKEYQVTEEDKKYFEVNGYWLSPVLISNDDLDYLKNEMERVFNGEIDFGAAPYEYNYWLSGVEKHKNKSLDVRKINNAFWINQGFRTLSTNKVVGKIASQLLGTNEIRLWHDQAIVKPGSGEVQTTSGNIGWHQDYGYWQVSNTTDMITAFIVLQDTDLKNGCLRTITGSHKWGLNEDSAAFFDRDLDKLKDKFSQVGKGEWRDEPTIMKAGQIAFHHALTFHGSGPNTTNTHRYAIALHMMPENCGYQSGKGWHHNVRDMGPLVKEGDLFKGTAFPVMYNNSHSEK